ncbi:peptide ligase PGM1-related protein [Mycolicibacterium baixiangningiae]|uniref:peptide ligase PGM1-related protein n=1 Tax=Mycolicibacterium baixiangningiae TaxID=2761578 RepID=UPI001865B790|nr:peptide ligase PGM1-related protein [Mycolicibacterium baixiangningiae]
MAVSELAESQSQPTLSELDEAARQGRFEALQARMQTVWDAMKLDLEDESVVIVPSVSVTQPVPGIVSAFEERFLFLLLLLRQPRLRLIYVTSTPVDPRIVEYYLALLPGVIPSHALARSTFVSIDDPSDRPLADKLLERPRLLAKIAAHIPNRQRCHLIPYSTTAAERDIALTLGIPMYGADPRLADLGSKTGCRRLFAECGVTHPLGAQGLHNLEEVADAIAGMLAVRPSIREVIVKTNEGVAGAGNALVDLTRITELPADERRPAIAAAVRAMRLESPKVPLEAYVEKFEHGGGIVEERIVGEELRSPSVQLRARPDGSVELLSTHDQLLGGTTGQSFLGCLFPADPAYSRLISEPALRIGERVAAAGALGRFAIDFVVVKDETGAWSTYAIEINLRKGGTTHPFLTLQFLTEGSYDSASGRFLTPQGQEKHLVATDHLESAGLRALSVDDLFDAVARHGMHFDQSSQTGVVFHMISSLSGCGRVGMTAVGDTATDAMALYQRAQHTLLQEAAAAARETALPG